MESGYHKHSSPIENRVDLNHVRQRRGIKTNRAYPVDTILIEPNALFRDGLERILDETRFRVISSAHRVAELPTPRSAADPGLILVGADEHPEVSAREIECCASRYPASKRVFLNHYLNREDLLTAIRPGVDACLSKTTTTQAFLVSLDLVMLGESLFSRAILPIAHCSNGVEKRVEQTGPATIQISDPVFHRLSLRELNTLRCLVQGHSNKVIARTFEITEATVKVHIKAILRKIRVANRTQAAIWAVKHLQAPT
jgi:two-component system nitrate/nitrite response regulator NarL